jgi:biotin transporter BioY
MIEFFVHGLIYFSNSSHRDSVSYETQFWTTTFFLCLIGLIFFLVSGIGSMIEMIRTSDRRFFSPMLLFVACV